jgi:hypothetical protein
VAKRYAVKVQKFNQDHDPGTGRFGGPGNSHMPTGGKPGPQGGGVSTKQRLGVAGATVAGGLGGQVAGEMGGAAAGGVVGGAIGAMAGPEGILPGAALGEKIGQISGEILGSLAGDTLGMKIGNKLMDVKAKADQHAIGMGAMMGGEAMQMAAWAATKYIPGLRAAAPLFEFLPSASKPAGLIAARSAQAAVDTAGSAGGSLLFGGGKPVPNAVKRGIGGAKAAVGAGFSKSRYVKSRLAKHFFDKPPAGYADKGTFASMYSSSLPNLFGPRAWSEISGTKFGGYVRQRVKMVAQRMDDAAAANDIDLTPAKPADVHAAAASLLQQHNQQQQGMQQQQDQHELDMAGASAPIHEHTHMPGSIASENTQVTNPAPAPGGNPTQPGGQKAGGPKAPFGKAYRGEEPRDKRGRWSSAKTKLRDRIAAAGGIAGAAGAAGEGIRYGVRAAHRARDKEAAHNAAKSRAREAAARRMETAQEKINEHVAHTAFHQNEVDDTEIRLRAIQPMFETPEVARRRQVLEEHLLASQQAVRHHYHLGINAAEALARARSTADKREADAGARFPGSKIYSAGRKVRGLFTHPQDAAWNAAKFGARVAARVLRKDLTLMRAPNDATARLYQQSGTPSDVANLRRMQATIDANRKIELNRSLSQPKVDSLQRAPGEDERMYRDRMHRVMQASIAATDKLRPQLFNGGASEAGLSGQFPDQQTKRYTVKTKLGKGGDSRESRFTLDVEFAKEWNTPDTMKQGLVYGWASVIEDNGQMVTDHEGDRVEEVELVKAAHHYISNSRQGGVLHDQFGHSIGHIVESVVFTKELQKALGIDLKKVGWLIGYQVVDPRVKLLVKGGMLKSFSIGGKGRRVPVTD